MDYLDNYDDIGREQLEDALTALDKTLDSLNNRDITDTILEQMDREENYV